MFLDATKANLFFAKGVIFVEGSAENLLVPVIAEIIERPLDKYGVSIVNVSSTAFNSYSKIFLRKNEDEIIDIPIAIITDLDIKDNHNCKGIVLGTKNLNLLSEFFKSKNWNKDLSSLKDEIFFSKDELKMQLKEFMKKNRLPNGSEDLINKEIEETDINIEKYREIKRNKKIEEYNIDNIRAFINKKQTLEYDILMGNLCEKFYRAILLTKKKDDNKIDEEIGKN